MKKTGVVVLLVVTCVVLSGCLSSPAVRERAQGALHSIMSTLSVGLRHRAVMNVEKDMCTMPVTHHLMPLT